MNDVENIMELFIRPLERELKLARLKLKSSLGSPFFAQYGGSRKIQERKKKVEALEKELKEIKELYGIS